jgi:hypothetical protein
MATYIAGVTDYIPQIQPFQPDLNFYANVMQTKQSRYDAAKKQINNLYGSLLNSPLSRDSNVKRREEFFKAIDQDIKKISGLDLSLQQNTDAALNVFKGFYEDKYMLDDMTKTKKYRSQVEKAEMLKACNDPEKCPGYWDEGVRDLQYRMEEYKNLSDDEALNYDIGTYDSYYNWKKDALKAAKDLNYKVEQDSLNGGYIIHDENGALVQGGLYNLFKSVYGDDARVQKNYNTKARVARKDYAYANETTFGSKDEAEKHYILNNINSGLTDTKSTLKTVSNSYDQVNSRYNQLEQKRKNKGLTPKDEAAYNLVVQSRESLAKTKASLENTISEIEDNIEANDINSLRQRADRSTAFILERNDINGLAESLANVKKSRTIKENQFSLISARGAEERRTASYQHKLELEKMAVDFGYDIKKKDYEYYLKQKEKDEETKAAEELQKPTRLTSVPGSDVKLDTEENPTAVFDRNAAMTTKLQGDMRNQTSSVLFDLFTAAKTQYDQDKNAGASQYLEKFGPNWKNIKNVQDLQNVLNARKISANALMTEVINKTSQKTNPTGDYDWAQQTVKSGAKKVDAAKQSIDAYLSSLKLELTANRKVVDDLKKSGVKNIDLLLNSSGMITTQEDFTKKYLEKAYADGNYNVDEDDAEDAYETFKENFYIQYNKKDYYGLEKGVGLEGGGMIKGEGLRISAMDAGKKTKYLNDVLSATSQALSSTGYKVVAGDITQESYDQDNDDNLQQFLLSLYNEAKTSKKDQSDRPVFNVDINSTAAGQEGVSAITFSSFSPDFIKKYVGTKESPGILYGKDLSKGVTLFYNNNEVNTSFKEGYEQSNLEVILKTKGNYKVDAFQDDAGTISYSYNELTGMVTAKTTYSKYENRNNKIVLESKDEVMTFPINTATQNHKTLTDALEAVQAYNIQTENAIAEYNKQKQNTK